MRRYKEPTRHEMLEQMRKDLTLALALPAERYANNIERHNRYIANLRKDIEAEEKELAK